MIIKANPTPLTRPGVSYIDNTFRAAGTNLTIVSPASNTSGIIVHRAAFVSRGVSVPGFSLLAKNASPTSFTDGLLVLGPDTFGYDAGGTSYYEQGKRELPLFVPPGLGIYSYVTASENMRRSSLDYTIL